MTSYKALAIPADDRLARLVSMMTSPLWSINVDEHMSEVYRARRMPHPEVHMAHIAPGIGPRSWRFQVCTCMTLRLNNHIE